MKRHMDFSLTREQEMIKKLARQFAEEVLEPAASDVDLSHQFPVDNFGKMAELGFTGIGIPKEYGGTGGGSIEEVIAVSEFAKDRKSTRLNSSHANISYAVFC